MSIEENELLPSHAPKNTFFQSWRGIQHDPLVTSIPPKKREHFCCQLYRSEGPMEVKIMLSGSKAHQT